MEKRLQKFISEAGVMSRRAAEEEIKKGRIKVNGITAVLGQKIDDALCSLFPLMSFIKEKVNDDGVVYISQRVTTTNNVYNNSKAYNKWIGRLMKCNCLYRLNIPFKLQERAYYYYVCEENFNLLWEIHFERSPKPRENTSQSIEIPNPNSTKDLLLNRLLPLQSAPQFKILFNILTI